VLAERLSSQLLAGGRASSALEVARRLLAVQGQDGRGVRLAVRARSEGLGAADVDRGLGEERSLLITWLCRGTLHLVASEDYPWLHLLTSPPVVRGNARRLEQEGVTPGAADRGVAVIERALAEEGPLSRARLRERLETAGVRTEGQALIHLLLLASLRGLIVRGPMVGGGAEPVEHAYVLVADWLGRTPPVSRERALAELARRYLAGHGPAGERDLARWAGLPLRDVRAGLQAVAPELHQRPDGLLELAVRGEPAALPPPRLLGAFDPVLLGWCSRDELLQGNASVVTRNGLFRPIALVGGRAAATWRLAAGEVLIEPFASLREADGRALAVEAEDVLRFLRT
jgi:hypothetical protein